MLIIGHRGAAGLAPENTLAAFRAGREVGVDLVELDVRATKDRRLVTLHDATLDRTTNGHGPLAALTYLKARRLDAGSWFAPQFAGERIPSLEAVLELLRHGPGVNLEIKEDALVPAVVRLVKRAGMLEQTVFVSFSAPAVRRVRRIEPTASAGLLVSPREPVPWDKGEVAAARLAAAALALGANLVKIHHSVATAELVRNLKRRALSVWVWGANSKEAIERVIASGADALTTDFPDLALRLRPHA